MKSRYHIKTIQQIMRPTLEIVMELHGELEISFRINVLALNKNPVLMEALSSEDTKRVKYYAHLVTQENPLRG